jgi:hypothetical protein
MSGRVASSVVVVLCAVTFGSAADTVESGQLLPVKDNGTWGYIDLEGTVVIEPQFDGAWEFAEGLAAIKVGEKHGYVDRTGKIVIKPQFDNALPFSEGLAAIFVEEKWGFIDTKGKLVIPATHFSVRSFSEGLAAVAPEGGILLQTDNDTKEERPFRFPKKFGFITKAGEFAIPPQFHDVGSFSQGLASASVGGKPVSIFLSGKGMLDVGFTNKKYGFVDKTGEFKIPARFDGTRSFKEGLAAAKLGDKWGYVDQSGEFVIKPAYVFPGFFCEGLAKVTLEEEGKFGYIDTEGRIVIEAQFDDACDFCGRLAPVTLGDKWLLVDRRADPVTKPVFDDAGTYAGIVLWVKVGEKLGYMTTSGKYIWRPTQ